MRNRPTTLTRILIFALVVVGGIATAIVSAPFIAATDLAKGKIAAQIEEWTGRPFTFVGEPQVKLFPYLSLTVSDAKISSPQSMGDKPFIEMDALTCRLRLWQFLIGRTEVAEFELVRPRFNLTVDAEGQANWKLRQGVIMNEAAEARRQPAGGTVRAASKHIREIKLGRFRIVDGTVTYDNAHDGVHEQLSAVSVSLRWPSIDEAATGTGSFDWRGQKVDFNGFVEEPIALLAGRDSNVRLAAASSPLRLSFTGKANAFTDSQFEGNATISTPSVRRVAQWLGTRMEEGPIFGASRIEGKVNIVGRSVSFPEAKMELDGNAGEGALGFDFADPKPRIFGTLAFEKLDLTAYLEALQAMASEEGPWSLAPVNLPFLDMADVDLRFSAGQLLLDDARIAKAAGTAQIDGGKLNVALGQAEIYGAPLTAEINTEIEKGRITSRASFNLDNVPADLALTDVTGTDLMDGQADMRGTIESSGESWGEFFQSMTGSATVHVRDGAFNLAELNDIASLAGGPDIDDPTAGNGTIPFSEIAGTLSYRDGVMASKDIHVEGRDFSVDLEAGVSLVTLTMRARGVLNARPAGSLPEVRRDIPFVVSGVWGAPIVMPDYERLIQRGLGAPRAEPGQNPAGTIEPPNG